MSNDDHDDDFEPLVGNGRTRPKVQAAPPKERASSFRNNWKWALPLIALSILVLHKRVNSYNDPEHVDSKHRDCPKTCQSLEDLYETKWGGDITNTSVMLKRAMEQREKLVAELKLKYETYYPFIFEDENGTSIGRTGFHGGDRNSDVSKRRYIRKMMMKILSVQMAVQKETSRARGCDCSTRYLQGSNLSFSLDDLPDHYARMVWVNAGHSSAAGHGNPFNETYTAFMEQAAKSTFQAVGIELEGRNYAMGGMSSSPELALCAEAVYGMDADLITWNFGMTDGRDWYRYAMFGNRRGAHRNRPLLLDMEAGADDDQNNPRLQILKELEESGLPTMYMALSYMYNPHDFEPDMENMTTQAEVDAVPEYLRYFRCGDAIEKGDLCSPKKYSEDCSPHKAPWHPGWKAHAINGYILGLFMVDLLIDALQSLETVTQPFDREQMMKMLQRDEDRDYDVFFNSTIIDHDDDKNKYFCKSIWNESEKEIYSLLYRSPTVCHTGLLPAETRYRGILTENDKSSLEHYDFGILKKEIDDQQPPSNATTSSMNHNPMALVYESKVDCPLIPEPLDYKDFFYTTSNSGETRLTVPSKAEKQAYILTKDQQQQQLHGLIVVCLIGCDWGKCKPGDMRVADVNGGNVTMAVNGQRVEEMTEIDKCTLLRGEQGYTWKPNDQGEYDITARVNVPGGYFRITSVILI